MRGIVRYVTVVVAILMIAGLVPAQAGETPLRGGTLHPTKILRPTAFGVSQPLRDMKPVEPLAGAQDREIPNREVTELPVLLTEKPVTEPRGEARLTEVNGSLAPSPVVAFDGLNSDTNQALVGFRVMPPDTQGAVGMNYYVQWINLVWAIYNKSDGSMAAGPYTGNQIWADALPGTSCANSNDGDPITLYDHGAQRWFMAQFMATSPYAMCLAVSQTPDPTGAWYAWQYDYGTAFPDYPKFGVWPDGYYMTVNEFGSAESATTVFDRTAMIAGDPSPAAVYFYIESVQPAFPQPTNWDGGPPPPAGSPNYNLAFYDDAWGNPADIIQICEFSVDWATPANSTFTCPAGDTDPGYIDLTAAGLSFDSDLCGYARDCIPQPGTQRLDALSDRFMFPANYRNLTDTLGYEVMVVTHSVDVDGSDHAGVRWYELRNEGSGWYIYDGGTFAPDSDNRWMGSAAVDQNGNIGLIYSISSSTTYPSVGYTARLASDDPGTMQSEVVLVSGGGSQSGGNRWGDYAAMHTDPDGCTFWGTAEYVASGGNFIWDTYVGAFSMPGCTPAGYGTLEGTVTNLNTGDPIAGALVQAGAYTTYTQADGSYGMNLPEDTYDVSVSAFGFAPASFTGIQIVEGETTVQDAALEPVGTAFIDGYVTGAVHGWPLYARIDVSYMGTNVATVFTDPFNGYYEVELPQGNEYSITATSMIEGYDPETKLVVLDPAGAVVSFALNPGGSVPWVSCQYSDGVPHEGFEGGFPPSGWSTMDLNGGDFVWKRNDEVGEPNRTPGADGFSAVAAAYHSGAWNAVLVSPVINMPADPALGLRFDSNFQDYAGNGDAYVEVSTDGGATWTQLWTTSTDEPSGGVTHEVDLSAYAGMAIQVRWRYTCNAGSSWFWQIDDVETFALPAPVPTAATEDFESWPPSGWTIVDNGGDCVWESTATTGRGNTTGGAGEAADADSDWCGSGTTMDTSMISPSYDFSALTEVWVEFKHYFNALGASDVATFEYSTDGGTNWNSVFYYTDDVGPETFLIDLSTALSGQADVTFRWTYKAGGWDWYWLVDEFRVYEQDPGSAFVPPAPDPYMECAPVSGALMEGFITDANTGDGLNGAIISDDQGNVGTSMGTPDDPAIGEGFYWLFTNLPTGEGPSTRTFTVDAPGYAQAQTQMNPVPDTVNRLDFGMEAGWLEVTPTHLESYLHMGEEEHQLLDIINHGGVDANVQVIPVPVMAGWDHQAPDFDLANLPGNTEPTSMGRAPHAAGPIAAGRGADLPLAPVPAYAVNAYPGNDLVHWDDLAGDPGTWTSLGTLGGAFYPTGDFYMGDFSKLYVLNYDTNAFGYLDTANGAFTAIGTATPGGGESWSGLTAAVDGTMYASGTTCAASTLYTVDPATGTATPVGPITNAPCIIDIAINAMGEMYGVDIVNDNLIQIDPATGAGTIVGSLGVSANYAQGLDFDEVTGVLYWAAYTSSGELRVIDTATGASTLVGAFPGGAEVCALGVQSFAGGGGLPWLVLTPEDGVVPAYEGDLPIDAHFIADGADHFGLFQAQITVNHDTPYDVNPVSVCFTKAFDDVPSDHWAQAFVHSLAGTRITYGCGYGTFCPDDVMTRGVMALWLLRARYGANYSPPPCEGIFTDVICEATPNADYIEALYNEGITAGCSTDPLMFCPDGPVTRAQMAVFLLAAKEGTDYTPPACTGIFADVPCPTHWAADWVEELFNRGITAGCGGGNFCPDDNTSRAQMSVFMTVNWDLPMCDAGQ